jgi:hypothetical protein
MANPASRQERLLLLSAAAVNVAFIALNRSRGAWLILLGCVAFLLLNQFRPRKIGASAAIAVGAIVAVLTVSSFHPALEGVLSLGRGLLPNSEAKVRGIDKSEIARTGALVRFEMTKISLATFAAHPLTGVGAVKTSQIVVEGHGVHGFALLGLASYGVLGLVPLVALLFPVGVRIPLGALAVGLPGIVISFLAQYPPLWLALAGLLAVQISASKELSWTPRA